MRGSGPNPRRSCLYRAGLLVAVLAASALLASCGGGTRQDASEPSGKFPVTITTSQFPTRQHLSQTTYLRLGVRNIGRDRIPDLAITISADKDAIGPFEIRDPQQNLSQPDRPVWILENHYPKLLGSTAPAGADTANSKTFAFGQLNPGDSVDAVWKVTPVRAGTFRLSYRVDAGLAGKARAVISDGKTPPTGSFVVEIATLPPQTEVTGSGQVVPVPTPSKGGGGSGQSQGQGGGGGGGTAPPVANPP